MNLEDLRGLRQPDQRSCGPSALVAAHMLLDETYRPESFASEVLAVHRRLTSTRPFGRLQLPWPRALGTPPWAAAAAMTSFTGVRHRTRLVRLGDRARELARIVEEVQAGRPVPVYVGSRWLPRHVVLAVGAEGERLRVFDPARGVLTEVEREAFVEGRVTTLRRWTTPWFAVVPAP